jgi:hypothetical protein
VWGIVSFFSQTLNIGVGGDIPTPGVPTSVRTYENTTVSSGSSLGNVYYSNSTVSTISDTREFNKVSYSGNIRTREVEDIAKKVTALVHAAGGRVDNSSASEYSAYISFVLPKSNFESFQSDIVSLVNPKLYTKYINQNNLLNQKQNIETNQADNATQIAATEKQKSDLTTSHKKTLASYNASLIQVKNQLVYINTQLQKATNTSDIEDLKGQQKNFLSLQSSYNSDIAQENSSYNTSLNSYNASLEYLNKNKTDLVKTDQKFTEDVETVNGTISINHISLWQLFDVYSPISLATILCVLFLAAFIYVLVKIIKSVKKSSVIAQATAGQMITNPNGTQVSPQSSVLEPKTHYYSLWYIATIIVLFLGCMLWSFVASNNDNGLYGDIPTPGVPQSVRTY